MHFLSLSTSSKALLQCYHLYLCPNLWKLVSAIRVVENLTFKSLKIWHPSCNFINLTSYLSKFMESVGLSWWSHFWQEFFNHIAWVASVQEGFIWRVNSFLESSFWVFCSQDSYGFSYKVLELPKGHKLNRLKKSLIWEILSTYKQIPKMKHVFLRNKSATITCEGNWPFCYQNQTVKFFASPLVTKPYLYGILLTIICVQSQAKAYLKTLLNAELHANSLFF